MTESLTSKQKVLPGILRALQSGDINAARYIMASFADEARDEIALLLNPSADETTGSDQCAMYNDRVKELNEALCRDGGHVFPKIPVKECIRCHAQFEASPVEPKVFICGVCNVPMTEVRPGEWQHTGDCLPENGPGEQT